jgi:beta-RFAP synthase
MTIVSTGSRLHFGLFNAGNSAEGLRFGGLGMMVHEPRVRVSVFRSKAWSGTGPNWERALEAARRVSVQQPMEVVVETCPPLHSGLGVGTQLAMATGRAVALELGIDLPNESLARIVRRGLRSGIGVHGFASGGFILDHGHSGDAVSSVERFHWPEDWSILLVRPPNAPVWHGPAEVRSFARRRDPTSSAALEGRLRILGGRVIEALAGQDLQAFGDCLHCYNRLAGDAFAEDQGGEYSSESVREIVQWFRSNGILGVGQSSWGPTVFAVVESKYLAPWRDSLAGRFHGQADVATTGGAESGFRIESQ